LGWEDLCLLFVTDRPEKHRKKTEEWLYEGFSFDYKGTRLSMRPDYVKWAEQDTNIQDKRHPHEVKREIYEREIKDKYDVLFVLERSGEDAEMYRELGLTVLEVK
jgi:hypothetical protein